MIESWTLVFSIADGTSYPMVNKTEGFPDHHACHAAGRQFEESWERWKTKWTTVHWHCVYKAGKAPVVPLRREPKE